MTASLTVTSLDHGSPPAMFGPRWRNTRCDEDPLPWTVGQLQLRLSILSIRQTSRPAGATAGRPVSVAAVPGLGDGQPGRARAVGPVHAVGRRADPQLVPRGHGRPLAPAACASGRDPDQPV